MPLEPDLIDWPYEAPKPMGDTRISRGLSIMFNYKFQPPKAFDGDIRMIADGGGGWIIVGSLYTSPNGTTWEIKSGAPAGVTGCAYGAGLYCVCGDQIWSSVNLDSYTQRTSGFGGNTLRDIQFANNSFVTVGGMGFGSPGYILTSSDGITWTSRTPGAGSNDDLFACAYGGGMWVACGNGGYICSSSDGTTWTTRNSGVTINFYSITYGNNLFVVGADNGNVFTSSDGITWTQRTTGSSLAMWGVCFGNGIFVCVGGNAGIYTSTDGISWTQRTAAQLQNFQSVFFGGGLWLAVSAEPSFIATQYSSDAITWAVGSTVGSGGEGNAKVVFI